jgi:hypothetical protein
LTNCASRQYWGVSHEMNTIISHDDSQHWSRTLLTLAIVCRITWVGSRGVVEEGSIFSWAVPNTAECRVVVTGVCLSRAFLQAVFKDVRVRAESMMVTCIHDKQSSLFLASPANASLLHKWSLHCMSSTVYSVLVSSTSGSLDSLRSILSTPPPSTRHFTNVFVTDSAHKQSGCHNSCRVLDSNWVLALVTWDHGESSQPRGRTACSRRVVCVYGNITQFVNSLSWHGFLHIHH